MYSKHTDISALISAIENYMRDNEIVLSEDGVTFLDRFIQNPSVQRLISIWIMNHNEAQLNALLLKTLPALCDLQPELQETAIMHMFQAAQTVSNLIPEPSDLDMVLESMGEPNARNSDWDGWADFNRPLFACTQQDISHLSKYQFFINNGIFTANMVLAMTADQMVEFDNRVNDMIAVYADFIYPDRIFSDKLIQLLQQDVVIQSILSKIRIDKPLKVDTSDTLTEEELIGITDEDMGSEDHESEFDLAGALGIHEVDLDSGEGETGYETRKGESPVSDITRDSLNDTAISRASTEATVVPTYWQSFNVYLYGLEQLIRYGKLHMSDIPDRELTQEEITVFYFMNQLLRDLSPELGSEEDYSVTTQPAPYIKERRLQPPQQRPDTPNWHKKLHRGPTTTSYEEWKAAQSNPAPSQPISKKEFYTRIKEPTHNVRIRQHIRDENRIHEERLAREPKGMPNWHKQYMASLRQKDKQDSAEEKKTETGERRNFKKGGGYG